MVSLGTAFAVAFLLAVVVFAVGVVWESLRAKPHTPKALQSGTDGGE
jgi:hypothetical protein